MSLSEDTSSSSDSDPPLLSPTPASGPQMPIPLVSHHSLSTRQNSVTHCVAAVPPLGMPLLGSYILVPVVGSVELHGDLVRGGECRRVSNCPRLRPAEMLLGVGSSAQPVELPPPLLIVSLPGIAWEWVRTALQQLQRQRINDTSPYVLLIEMESPTWVVGATTPSMGFSTHLLQALTPPTPELCPVDIPQTLRKVQLSADSRLGIVGAAESGKSTAARFFINKLLSGITTSVLFVDLDVGHPEFFPCGCVSAVLVRNPLHGHNLTPTSAEDIFGLWYMGDTTVQRIPDLMVHAVHRLVKVLPKGIPLVVCTHGWVEGIGKRITHEVLRCLRIDMVVHFQKDTDTWEADVIADRESGLNMFAASLLPHPPVGHGVPPSAIVSVPFLQQKGTRSFKKDHRTGRDHALLSYLLPMASFVNFVRRAHTHHEDTSVAAYVASLTPLAIATEKLQLLITEDFSSASSSVARTKSQCRPEDIVGTVVGLIGAARPPGSLDCVGIGVVRAVVGGVLHLLTPLSLTQLRVKNVTTLLVGRMTVPSWMRLEPLVLPYVLGSAPTGDEGSRHHFSQKGSKKKRTRT